MNKNIIKFVLAVICVVQVTSLIGMEKQYTMLLPINAMLPVGKRAQLSVEMPDNFKPYVDPTSSSVFFTPINGGSNKCSRIITTHILLNQRVTAVEMIGDFKKDIEKKDPHAKVIAESDGRGEGYASKRLLIAYCLKGKEKLLLINYFSGSHDCSGYQYYIALVDGINEDAAKAELEKFEKEKTKVVNF